MNISSLISVLHKVDQNKIDSLKSLVLETKGLIILLGNGGSNAISSHIAEDYTKALKKPSISFSDSSRLTCYANDYGYEKAFEQYLREFANEDSLVILISSSGNSLNILNCAEYCSEHKIKFVIFSGFDEKNKLRNYLNAELDFWVDSKDYGVVECSHEVILHSII